MPYLPDSVLSHLRKVAELPDLSGTRYQVESELGRGGMGVVYAAMDEQLGRRVALKVTASGFSGGAAQRLMDEAKIVASLEHPGIVPVYDAGCLADGRFYCAMKLVEGKRLREHAQDLTLRERLRVFQKVCEAVAFAHSRGVIHRDLKPENIMVGAFGEVFVMDWGVALAGTNEESGVMAGTPRYMAPEQASSNGIHLDSRADVYALGVILRELAGEDAPKALKAIAAKASSVSPDERYPTATGLRAETDRYLDGLAVQAYRENVWERATRFAARNQTLLLLLAAYVVVRFLLLFLRPAT